jgi:hypothetical protein
MDKDKILDEIFGNDPYGLLNIKSKTIDTQTADTRLLASFQEINVFYKKNKCEPKDNPIDISEFRLSSRLKHLRNDKEKVVLLKEYDIYHLLPAINKVKEHAAVYSDKKEINSFDDIFDNDTLNILNDDTGLFEYKHIPKDYDRAKADFIARRKPCKDFAKYEIVFKKVQQDLANGKRKLVAFEKDNIIENNFYVHNGILLLLEQIDITQNEKTFSSGKQTRKDGRTRCIFENGTESNMLYRSLAKILYANGRVVTENIDEVNEKFHEYFGNISETDTKAGYIYVLKSMSKDSKISKIKNLYKIGYSKNSVEDRLKNTENEPTYLMAPVSIESIWKCYNLNPQKLEQLLHQFFGNSCLDIDIFDNKGKRHQPREWFIAPISVISQAIKLIISGKIIDYIFDSDNLIIVKRGNQL